MLRALWGSILLSAIGFTATLALVMSFLARHVAPLPTGTDHSLTASLHAAVSHLSVANWIAFAGVLFLWLLAESWLSCRISMFHARTVALSASPQAEEKQNGTFPKATLHLAVRHFLVDIVCLAVAVPLTLGAAWAAHIIHPACALLVLPVFIGYGLLHTQLRRKAAEPSPDNIWKRLHTTGWGGQWQSVAVIGFLSSALLLFMSCLLFLPLSVIVPAHINNSMLIATEGHSSGIPDLVWAVGGLASLASYCLFAFTRCLTRRMALCL